MGGPSHHNRTQVPGEAYAGLVALSHLLQFGSALATQFGSALATQEGALGHSLWSTAEAAVGYSIKNSEGESYESD